MQDYFLGTENRGMEEFLVQIGDSTDYYTFNIADFAASMENATSNTYSGSDSFEDLISIEGMSQTLCKF